MRDFKGRFIKGSEPWNYGQKGIYSKDTLSKMRNVKLGRKLTDEHKAALSRAHDPTYTHSKETRKLLSERAKEQWANNKKYRSGMIGENHPNWNGGESRRDYSLWFKEGFKNKIRKRDRYRCQLCGKSQKDELYDINQRLTIHHIRFNKKDIFHGYFITLCCSCNAKMNYNRSYWRKFWKSFMRKKGYLPKFIVRTPIKREVHLNI